MSACASFQLPHLDTRCLSDYHHQVHETALEALGAYERLKAVIRKGEAWAWRSNSCHLDTFMMQEMVAYSFCPTRFTTSDKTDRERRVVEFLQAPIASRTRDNFWKNVMVEGHVPFGATADVIAHVEWVGFVSMVRRMGTRPPSETSLIGERCTTFLRVKGECTNGCAAQTSHTKHPCILLPAGWYASEDPTTPMVMYQNLQDAVLRYFAHPSHSQMQCDHGCQGRVTQQIDASTLQLPNLLVLGTGASDTILPFTSELTIGVAKYTLISVAFRTSAGIGHYACNFRLPDSDGVWYTYNDAVGGGRVAVVSAHDTPPMPGGQPRAWYYLRTDSREFNDVDLSLYCSAYVAQRRYHRPDFVLDSELV